MFEQMSVLRLEKLTGAFEVQARIVRLVECCEPSTLFILGGGYKRQGIKNSLK